MEDPPHLITQHTDIAVQHRFRNVVYQGTEWDLAHLDPYAFRAELQPGLTVDVVVFYSCHCFTHAHHKDERGNAVPGEEIYLEGSIRRVLNPERWRLSRELLPGLVRQLHTSHIRVLGGALGNYATFSATDRAGTPVTYGIFFDVRKDRARKKRLLLRVQSAYIVEPMTQRLLKARKVNLHVLLRAVHEGREIKP